MIKALFLSTGAVALVAFAILQTGQLAMLWDLVSPLFV